MKKRILSILLAMAMVIGFLPILSLPAMAATSNTYGDFTVSSSSFSGVSYASNTLTITQAGTYQITQTNGGTSATTERIAVDASGTVNITLSNINISTGESAFDIRNSSVVNLTLSGTNTLTSSAKVGLHVSSAAELTIDGAGSLNATGGGYSAGIGGEGALGVADGPYFSSGKININGGTITAIGASGGAGIGGGYSGVGGIININGGTVTAIGNSGGAGIGGGSKAEIRDGNQSGSAITIGGNAVVTATGGESGAGIGGAQKSDTVVSEISDKITIGGNAIVTATGGSYAAGIGCGKGNSGTDTIIINGGTVTAKGGERGAGIGGGFSGAIDNVTINGGTVMAEGGHFKPGISGTTVTIGSTAIIMAASDSGAISCTNSNISSVILVANYWSASGNIEVKSENCAVLVPTVTFTPTIAYKSIALTVPSTANYTLYKAGIQQSHSSPANKTFNVSTTGINSFSNISDTIYTATAKLYKDGNLWTDGPFDLVLSTSDTSLTGKISAQKSGGVYTFSNLDRSSRYYIWEDASSPAYTKIYTDSYFISRDVNYYTVTFKSENGIDTLFEQTVLSGKAASYSGTLPTKTSTPQYTYTFSKWVTEKNGTTGATLSNITAPTTVYASFTAIPCSHTITWMQDSSTTIDTTSVNDGLMPTHENPTKKGYTFTGWTPGLVSTTKDATYTANWTLDTYAIEYTLNGGTVSTPNPVSYKYTDSAITLNNPTRDGYSFVGWSGTGLTGNENTTVTIAAGSTGARSYTANWKAEAPSKPDQSIVTEKTDKSITINTQDDYEYSVNGSNWGKGTAGKYTFTDLTANTPYNLISRKAAVTTVGSASAASDASAHLTVKTKAAMSTAPVAPTIGTGTDKPTSNSITVSTVAGNEYYISTSSTADWSGTPNGYVKATVNGTHKFDSLNAATQYYIHVRVAETGTAMPSASSNMPQYTLPVTPTASDVTINYKTETISFANTHEVSTAQTGGSGIPSNGSISSIIGPTPQSIYVRVKASSSGAPASEWKAVTVPARSGAPTAITAVKTKNSITVTEVPGQEYRIGTGDWQDSGTFAGLSPDTSYTVSARVKAVITGSVSFASEAYSKFIKTKSDGSSGFALPTISVTPTYAPGKTLNDIHLPAGSGWVWSTPATVPTVTNTGYSAVYTPSYADMVDYSDIPGYAVDGSGKVTITKTIPLTVSRATPTAADFTYTAPTALGYDKNAKTATVTVKSGISGMGTVTVKYYDEAGAVVGAPTNAGAYTVKIYIAQGSNYAAATELSDSAWKFTIAKATQDSLSITDKPTSVTYGDILPLAVSGGSGNGAVTWTVTSGSSATVNENTGEVTIIGVGETTITAKKADDGNYTAEVTNYTFTPSKRLITVDAPSATGGWTKIYDGKTDFAKTNIAAPEITNKVGEDNVYVSVESATFNNANVGSAKNLTITYSIVGIDSGKYSVPADTVIANASITAATPTITLKKKTATYNGKIVDIDAATVKGVTGDTTPDGTITYTYYNKDTCTDGVLTSVDKSGAASMGGAPKNGGTYYVKATIAAKGNYTQATSDAVTLTIYYPSSGENETGAPVIVDGKTIDMGTSEVKDGKTTVTVDQKKMNEQLENAKDSVVIPVTSKTDTATAQLVVQNVEKMAARDMTLSVKVNDISYDLPATAVDTATLLKNLGATDSAKVPLNIVISHLPKNAVTIKGGTLMLAPVSFTVTASFNGKSVAVDSFESYVQRDIELPSSIDPKTITTAVVVEANGTERHVPTEVYLKGGKWYAKVNSMTNSTYALIQNSASFTDSKGQWYDAVVTEMASRKIINGVGENMFACELSITRAEFAAIIVRALGLPTNGTSTFADVATSAWYNGAVGTAFERGIVSGVGDNRFDPDANITREEAMVMVTRAAKLCGMNTTDSGAMGLAGFADAAQISSWAYDSAAFNVRSGLIKGSNGKIDSRADITRAETATVVLRLLQKAGLVDVRAIA